MLKTIPKALIYRKIIFWFLDHNFGALRCDEIGKKARVRILGIDLMPSTQRALAEFTRQGWRSVLGV